MLRLSTVVPHWLDDAPSIIVSASCLHNFGFEIGSRVVVEVVQGVITIKILDSEEDL